MWIGMTIFFYKVCEPYGCFSNFSPHSIELEGYTWLTSEHYYQAQKFVGTPHAHLCGQIRTAPSPDRAAELGRNLKYRPRENWDVVKVEVMYKAVFTKFSTHPDLANLLLSTNQELIIENSPTDAYWGCGPDGNGQNQLGKILMQVRAVLRQH
jgi:hypothetical protein